MLFRSGGILADAAPAVLRELDDVGRLLGRSFQLVDDLLGVFAPEEVTGKSNLSDLREGKRTPLMEHARTEPVWAVVVQHLGRPDLDHGTAADLRQALARSAAPETVRRAAWVDLVEVVARTRRGSLPPTMAEVVLRLSDQVGAALADAARYVEIGRAHV